MPTTSTSYKFKIRCSQSGVVIIKGGFASLDAALAYSKRVHSFDGYDLPKCEEIGVKMFRHTHHEPANHSSILVEDSSCVVLVGPEGMNMNE